MRKTSLLLTMMLLLTVWAFGQDRTITGTVTDEKGAPLPKASVQVKGTNKGTVTRDDGTYSLVLPANASTLVFSSVDMATQEVRITSSSSYSIALISENKNMDEVVVVAYGTVKKEALTGSVGTIKSAAIEKRPVGNITRAIEGVIPGVITTSGSGQPGAGTDIRVRGFGSINATSEPLFVVDGIPYVGGTSNINPDDVESITVLKDASSTALYGSRAANGVIVITTKKGKKGRNSISVKASQGVVSRGLQEYDRTNAFQYYPLMWEAYRNSLVYPASGTGISLDSANRVASGLTARTSIRGLLGYNPFNVAANAIVRTDGQLNPAAQTLFPDDLDWTKDLVRNGSRKDYGINFSGGSDKSDYFLSLGYLNEQGFTKKTDFERYAARLNVNVQPLKWLKTGLNLSGNFSNSNSASEGGGIVNPFNFTRTIAPIYPVYAHNMTSGAFVLDEKGNQIFDLGNFAAEPIGIQNGIPNRAGTSSGRHAIAELLLNELLFRRTVVSARSATDITLTKDLKFTNNISFDYQSQGDNSFENTLVGDGAPGGRSSRQSRTWAGFVASQLFNYNKKIGSHRIDVLAGHESFNQYNTDLNGFKQGQSLSGNTELGNFTTINSLNSSIDKYRIESYLSRVSYDYKGKYFATGSIRTDGNSRFASESRWGTFWSAGGGWNVDKESFLKDMAWINSLKLRSNYGVVGVADGIGFYAYQGLYDFANNANEPGIVQSQTAFLNRKLSWEKNKQFDIGIDFSLFKNRLNGSIEYYNRVSADLLFAVPQPLSSGALTVQQNTATMYNKGVELQLSGDIIHTKNFTWNTTVNLSTVNNKITKMPAVVPEFITGTKKYSVGHSIFDYWLRSYYGVDPADGAALYLAQNTAAAATRRLIANKGGGFDTVTTAIANGRFEYNGSAIPDLYGSFTQTFTVKDFTLSALFTFQSGGKTYDGNYQTLMSAGTYGTALHVDILKRWQKPGDITNIPRMDNGRRVDFDANSSRWLVDASYFNIRTLNLTYNLPKSILKRIKISNAQIFISAENVAFFSKRTGLNNQAAFSGVTNTAYPPARIITTGLTFNL